MAVKAAVPSQRRANQLLREDTAFHDWYRFVLSFPAHLVRKYLHDFELNQDSIVLDPFCGTGTTLVEAKLAGISSIGIEANPLAYFASTTKTNWEVDPDALFVAALQIAEGATKTISSKRSKDKSLLSFNQEQSKLLIRDSISPVVLDKTLILKKQIEEFANKPFYAHLQLALAKSTTFSASNLRFGPEVGLGKIKQDADVVRLWLNEVEAITQDLKAITYKNETSSITLLGDSRSLKELLKPKSIDAVITSPPYPNEKDYSRTTRLETVLLDFASTRQDLQAIKKTLVRSNTRGVYKGDDDAERVKHILKIEELATEIEKRRIALNKTSGFEKLYAKVTREYFGGMSRHLDSLKYVLRPGAKLAYVVGDQASYLRVMIRTGELIASIAEGLGYKVLNIDLFRERFASATKEMLREEVVVLTWEGK